MTTKAQQKANERQDAVDNLLKILQPNCKVYTNLKSVSSSGMSRQISLYCVEIEGYDGKPSIKDITHLVGKVLGLKVGSKGGLSVGGCGMDMGFEVVYRLGRNLWPNGTPDPHSRRNGEPDHDGGYALKQEWL